MSEVYYDVIDMVEAEIKNITKQSALDQNSLCNLDKLVDISKDCETIMAMKHSGNYSEDDYYDDYSRRGSSRMINGTNGMSRRNYSRSSYNDRMCYDDSYSGHGDKEHMLGLMEEALEMASTNEEREEIRKMIKKMESR